MQGSKVDLYLLGNPNIDIEKSQCESCGGKVKVYTHAMIYPHIKMNRDSSEMIESFIWLSCIDCNAAYFAPLNRECTNLWFRMNQIAKENSDEIM